MGQPTDGRRRICVFCGAKPGNRSRYLEVAAEFGTWLGANGLDLVYGGGGAGLMGTVAESAQRAGAYVTGVVPHHLLDAEGARPRHVELIVVRSMHHRKATMYRLADAFVALPGGVGTLDELMEISTWAKLGLHDKPTVVLNPDGFYDGLLSFLDGAVRAGLMTAAERRLIQDVGTTHEVGRCLGFPPQAPRRHAITRAHPSDGPPQANPAGGSGPQVAAAAGSPALSV